MKTFRSSAALLSLAAAVLALAACRGSEEAPAPQDEGGEGVDEPVTVQEPATSIIRPEVSSDLIEQPPEPLMVTIGLPEGAKIDEAAEEQLAAVLESKAVAEGWPVVLRGHSDSEGSDASNLRASQRRAEAVAEWLVERGVAEDRIRIVAFGEQNPVAPNANPDGTPNEEGRARNRRVELIVSPDGLTKKEAEAAGTSRAKGQDTAVVKAVERAAGVKTP